MALGPAGFHAAGLADGAAVKQELFGEGGFARVGVADDGKGTPAGDLRGQIRHGIFPPC